MPSEVLSLLFLLLYIIGLGPTIGQLPASDSGLQGEWRLLRESIGISAMHMQLLKNNKVVVYDRTDFGASNLSLPNGRCRFDPNDTVLTTDCTAHSTLYDFATNDFRALTVQTDTWCSSGAMMPDGTLVQTGGFNDGDHVVRTLVPCDSCDWVEYPGYLASRRWYASDQILPDGRIIVVGGRAQFSYEFFPRNNQEQSIWLNFLYETSDSQENNLYPFLHLLPDGNLFIFANTRSILFDYRGNRVVREFPVIPGGEARNYPSSGSSILLPLDDNSPVVEAEIMVCGGTDPNSFRLAIQGTFIRASSTCGRLKPGDLQPAWTMETMPMPRVMGDMLLLPDGNVIVVNGAGSGTAGWEFARDPVTRPLIYYPSWDAPNRFAVMASAGRPRLYHSTAVLLLDGRVLVGGSNPHVLYKFSGVEFPTDLSLESFSPPYLSAAYDPLRPRVVQAAEVVGYGTPFSITFTVSRFLAMGDVSVRIVAPGFSTHSFSMNQRMVVLRGVQVWTVGGSDHLVTAVGPSTREIAPPGYYMLFLVHSGIPSPGVWVKVQ